MTTNVFRIEVPGKPVAQARPRFSTRGGFARAYDTKPVADHKAYFKGLVAAARPEKLFLGPCRVVIRIEVERPKSWPKKWIHASTKPDADNFAKLAMDCLEGLVYKNDSQVIHLEVIKSLVCATDKGPSTFVTVEEYEH